VGARTFVVGDIHGDIAALNALLEKLPVPDPGDSLVFLGDYIDRGPASAEVIAFVRGLQRKADFEVVCLRGNHEDGWLRVIDEGWDAFVAPPGNGCLAALRSYTGHPNPEEIDLPSEEELDMLLTGSFFPPDVVEWMRALPFFHEDEHAIYVHAGLIEEDGVFVHPEHAEPAIAMLWTRSEEFFRDYRGKRVVVGHTMTDTLPPELSSYTPADPGDLWAGPSVIAIDTGAGKGGFLTALELPALRVWESR
jgi:serine/threonine protein phosphatase 1